MGEVFYFYLYKLIIYDSKKRGCQRTTTVVLGPRFRTKINVQTGIYIGLITILNVAPTVSRAGPSRFLTSPVVSLVKTIVYGLVSEFPALPTHVTRGRTPAVTRVVSGPL